MRRRGFDGYQQCFVSLVTEMMATNLDFSEGKKKQKQPNEHLDVLIVEMDLAVVAVRVMMMHLEKVLVVPA